MISAEENKVVILMFFNVPHTALRILLNCNSSLSELTNKAYGTHQLPLAVVSTSQMFYFEVICPYIHACVKVSEVDRLYMIKFKLVSMYQVPRLTSLNLSSHNSSNSLPQCTNEHLGRT